MSDYAFRKEDGTIERRWGAGYGAIWELCTKCDGGGEEEGEYGPKGCGNCGGRGEVEVGYDPEGDRTRDGHEFIREIVMFLQYAGTKHFKLGFDSLISAEKRRQRIMGVF